MATSLRLDYGQSPSAVPLATIAGRAFVWRTNTFAHVNLAHHDQSEPSWQWCHAYILLLNMYSYDWYHQALLGSRTRCRTQSKNDVRPRQPHSLAGSTEKWARSRRCVLKYIRQRGRTTAIPQNLVS